MQSTLQLMVSANSMILDFAHFSPLFCASANLSLLTIINDIGVDSFTLPYLFSYVNAVVILLI